MNDTESCCEVVKITSIEKHPNADRLEIAKFAFANGVIPDYQVVVGKSDFVVGDLAVYVSDDMLVPVTAVVGRDKDGNNLVGSHPQFGFLEIKSKNGYHRVRACRLRGQMSTGLLIKNTINAALGKDVSTDLGVLRYVSPLDAKENSFQNTGTALKPGGFLWRLRKWLTKKLSNPVKIPEYSVLSLRKVPDLFAENEPVIITEKIHGSNIRFGKVSGRVYIGSHRTEKSDSRNWLLRRLFPRNTGGGYYGKDVWTEWFKRTFSDSERLAELPNNIIFYGELFGPGIQPWTYGLLETQVMVYDAYDLKSKRWLTLHEIIAELPLNVKIVPMFGANVGGVGFNRENTKKLAEGNTEIKTHFPTDSKHKCNDREGVVVRSIDWKKAGKMVSDRYLASEH